MLLLPAWTHSREPAPRFRRPTISDTFADNESCFAVLRPHDEPALQSTYVEQIPKCYGHQKLVIPLVSKGLDAERDPVDTAIAR
jgi:hypothetical protein